MNGVWKATHLRKGYAMTRNGTLKSALGLLVLFLTLAVGSRLWWGPAFVNAGNLVQYKVVSAGSANTVYEYEKLLNNMAFQGWQFDHAVAGKSWAVFKK